MRVLGQEIPKRLRQGKEGEERESSKLKWRKKAELLAHWCDDDSDTALVMVRMAPRKTKASAILSDMKHFRQAVPMTGLKERKERKEKEAAAAVAAGKGGQEESGHKTRRKKCTKKWLE